MTLQASGSMTMAQIATELGVAIPQSMSTASTNPVNWLADRSGLSCTMPTHFYGKMACKLVDTVDTSTTGTVHNFGTVTFGPHFTGRRLVIVVGGGRSTDNNLNLVTLNVAGTNISYTGSGSVGTHRVACHIGFANPSGTSGNITATSSDSTNAMTISVYAVSGVTSVSSWNWARDNGVSGGGTAIASTAVAGGIQFYAAVKGNPDDDLSDGMTCSGITERRDYGFGYGGACQQIIIGYDTQTTAGARSFNWGRSSTYLLNWVHCYAHFT